MSKLIKKIVWDLDRPQTEMYVYGEADFEANKAMQEPLEKLYKYENQPDIREKVIEYIGELETEIERLEDKENTEEIYIISRIDTLEEVVDALKGKLEG